MKRILVLLAPAVAVSGAVAAAIAAPTGDIVPRPANDLVQVAQAVDQATLTREGQTLFARECAVCHGANAQGGDGPVLRSNRNLVHADAVTNQIINGGQYMPPFGESLNDRQVMAIATFIRNSFGNSFGPVTQEDVTKARPAAR